MRPIPVGRASARRLWHPNFVGLKADPRARRFLWVGLQPDIPRIRNPFGLKADPRAPGFLWVGLQTDIPHPNFVGLKADPRTPRFLWVGLQPDIPRIRNPSA